MTAAPARLTVKASPGAGRNSVTGFRDGVLHVRVAAAPEKGKANRELTDFLSVVLGVRKSAVRVVKGTTARTKIIEVEGLSEAEVLRRLEPKKEGA